MVKWVCTCADHGYRHMRQGLCKHAAAVWAQQLDVEFAEDLDEQGVAMAS